MTCPRNKELNLMALGEATWQRVAGEMQLTWLGLVQDDL